MDPAGPRLEVLESVLAEEGIELSDASFEDCPVSAPYEEWLGSVIARERGSADPALAARLMVRAAGRYRSLLKESGPAWLRGAVEFAERAAADGLALGIVSRLPNAEVAQALAGSGLDARFKVVVGAEDLEESDSRSAAYRLAVARLNTEPPLPERLIHPHEVVAIEASDDGVRAAAAAGLVTIAIGELGEAPPEANHVVGSLAGLELGALDSG